LRNLPVRDDAVALAIRALSSKSPVVTIPKVSAISLNWLDTRGTLTGASSLAREVVVGAVEVMTGSAGLFANIVIYFWLNVAKSVDGVCCFGKGGGGGWYRDALGAGGRYWGTVAILPREPPWTEKDWLCEDNIFFEMCFPLCARRCVSGGDTILALLCGCTDFFRNVTIPVNLTSLTTPA